MSEHEGSDFSYADDFETVDDSDKMKTIKLRVTYHGKLPAQDMQGDDLVYADDFDTAEEGFKKQIVRHMVEHFTIQEEQALAMASKYAGDIQVNDPFVQQLGADYFAIQILMAEKIIPYQPM